MQRKFKGSLVFSVLLGLSACSASYSREDTIQEFVDEGLDEATATCIVDGMYEQIGEDRLDDRGDPTEEELAIITSISMECLFGGE
ncbi:MAG: hypothetical protein O3C27_05910 [Actinomycetota bacterium]|nr:hypothetical protein [Actinomycetota bacterium]